MDRTLAKLCQSKVAILGFGAEGHDTYQYLRRHCRGIAITVVDELPVEQLSADARAALASDSQLFGNFGGVDVDCLDRFDVVIKSPGIPETHRCVVSAAKAGVEIVSQTSLFLELCPYPVVGVTGTKGKSTTASLIHHILRSAGRCAHLVGNIGAECGGKSALLSLDDAKPGSIFVYEMSSFQLDGLSRSPEVAVLLDIFPEHLDYHQTFERYVHAKAGVTRHQSAGSSFIYKSDSAVCRQIADGTLATRLPYGMDNDGTNKCYVDGNMITRRGASGEVAMIDIGEVKLRLPGMFNITNVLAAITAAKVLEVPDSQIISGIKSYQPLPGRLDYLGEYNGITFVDGSIATVPESTIAHLRTVEPPAKTLILGGVDRGIGYARLAEEILAAGIRTLILFEDTGPVVASEVARIADGRPCPASHLVGSMEDAVRIAYELTPEGSTCLNSPAAASRGGLFRNYRERSQAFRHWVVEQGCANGDDGSGK